MILLVLLAAAAVAAQEPSGEPAAAIPGDPEAFVIPIHGDIDNPSWYSSGAASKGEERRGGNIIFDIDTFGGRVDSALQITTLIGSLDET